MEDKVKSFKHELSCYKYYLKRLKELDAKIDENFYAKTGVSAISYDKIPAHSSEEAKIQYRLSLIEKGDKLALERDRIAKQIKHIEDVVNMMPKIIKRAIIEIYIKGRTYIDLQDDDGFYWTSSGIYKAIERELNKVL